MYKKYMSHPHGLHACHSLTQLQNGNSLIETAGGGDFTVVLTLKISMIAKVGVLTVYLILKSINTKRDWKEFAKCFYQGNSS